MSRKLSDYPELMLDWDKELNSEINPSLIPDGSHIRISWRCHKCGRIWQTPVKQRTILNTGFTCDSMERKTKSLKEELVSQRGSLAKNRPDISAQWHPTKNGSLTPNDLTCGSEYKAWWIDSEGYEWLSAVNVRCRANNVSDVVTRRLIVGRNDLATMNPYLALEWNYNKNGNLYPSEVMPYTDKKVWWKCHKGHEWRAYISSRTMGRGCPICNKERGTSFPEQAVFFYVKQMFPDAENRYLVSGRDEIDIFIPSISVGIEFDGDYYHGNEKKQAIDFRKNERLQKEGIIDIRIVEKKARVPDNTTHVIRYEGIKNGIDNFDATILEILSLIALIHSVENRIDVNIERDTIKIWEQYIVSEKEKSIITKRPDLIDEWNFEKNGSLQPEYISYSSNKKVWWRCRKCGYEWLSPPSNRTRGCDCPVCSGNIIVSGMNDLKTTHPHIACYWDYTRNRQLSPESVSSGSSKNIWWKCSKIGRASCRERV